MDIMDEWISSQWERKKTKSNYTRYDIKITALKERSSLIPCYLVRYADDFVIITDSQMHAEMWKRNIQKFLQKEMRLTLSMEKTIITDVRKKYIHFLGYEYKVVRGKSKTGYITRTLPDRIRLKNKVDLIAKEIKGIPLDASREQAITKINIINSQIRGLINYYENCTRISNVVIKHAYRLQRVAKKRLEQYNGTWLQANRTQNLMHVHKQYHTKIPAIKFRDIYIGVTSLGFCKWSKPFAKIQDETSYTDTGRVKYLKRTKKLRQKARLDETVSEKLSDTASKRLTRSTLNFEFIMNRAYALNRDRWIGYTKLDKKDKVM
jgi:RNA-directed DNA polymerase